jgi:hypothetical protein
MLGSLRNTNRAYGRDVRDSQSSNFIFSRSWFQYVVYFAWNCCKYERMKLEEHLLRRPAALHFTFTGRVSKAAPRLVVFVFFERFCSNVATFWEDARSSENWWHGARCDCDCQRRSVNGITLGAPSMTAGLGLGSGLDYLKLENSFFVDPLLIRAYYLVRAGAGILVGQ